MSTASERPEARRSSEDAIVSSDFGLRRSDKFHFKPALPFVLSDYLTTEERARERSRRQLAMSMKLGTESDNEKEESIFDPAASVRSKLRPQSGSNFLEPPSLTETGYQSRASLRMTLEQTGGSRSTYETASTFFEEEPKTINYKNFKVLSMDEENRKKEEETRKERNLQTLSDLEKLKKYYYNEYMGALRSKIDKQKQTIKKKEENLSKKMIMREEKKRRDNLTPRGEYVPVSKKRHNFLKRIPKSHYYLIIGLEDQLRQQGKLKSQSDYDEFWETIQTPEIYSRFFRNVDQMGTTLRSSISDLPGSSTAKTKGGKLGVLQHFQPMVQIRESTIEDDDNIEKYPENGSLKLSSARRSIASHKTGSATPTTPSLPRRGSIGSFARAAAIALDQKYPKMELPPLACFTLALGEQEKDPYEERLRISVQKKAEGRKSVQKRLKSMYETALSNAASTRVILDAKPEVRALIDGPSVKELAQWMLSLSSSRFLLTPSFIDNESPSYTSFNQIQSRYDQELAPQDASHSYTETRENRSLMTDEVITDNVDLSGIKSFSQITHQSSKTFQSRESRDYQKKESYIREDSEINRSSTLSGTTSTKTMKPQIPLSIDEIALSCSTKEAKTLSSLWNNPEGRRVWNDLIPSD